MTESEQANITVRFGKAMRKRRWELGLSQEELAIRSGLHRTYVADIERGSRNISLRSIEKIARGLEIPIWTLLAKYGVEDL